MYYNKKTRVVVNQSVNEFYTWLLFKIDALPQDVAFPLYIAVTFFNNLSPDVRDFLISEGFQIPLRQKSLWKPEAYFGHYCVSGNRKEDQNNKSGSTTSERKPPS